MHHTNTCVTDIEVHVDGLFVVALHTPYWVLMLQTLQYKRMILFVITKHNVITKQEFKIT